MTTHETGSNKPISQLDLTDPFVNIAVGNLQLANTGIDPKDVEILQKSGIIDQVESQAGENFTFVHSTTKDMAEKILVSGYNVGGVPESSIQYSLAQIVPKEYPQARSINTAVLGYRYRNFDSKLVFQFPFPFPEQRITDPNGAPWGAVAIWGSTDLGDDGGAAYDNGYFVEDKESGDFYIPPKFIAGVIDMNTGEYTPNATDERESKSRPLSRNVLRRLGFGKD